MPRTAGVLIAVGTLAGLLTGCDADSPRAGCAWLETQAPADDAGSTVILVDGSASVRGAGRPDYGQMVEHLLKERVEAGDTFSLGTFGGPAGDVVWAYRGRSADWKASADYPGTQNDNRDDAVGCIADDVTAAQRVAPSDGGTDVLAALATGIGLFDKGKGPRRLLVLSDGLSTTGCADLRTARFGSDQEIKAIASVCAAGGAYSELPDLRGVKVSFVALGRSAGDQPSANRAQRTWLGRLWTALCVRAGDAATSCTGRDVPVVTAASGAPGGTGAGTSPSDSAASVPADPLVRYAGSRSRTFTLPGAALFDTLSARVHRSAVPALTGIADRARATPGLDRVEVYGYVDPRGGSGNNRSLSQRRADAVGKVLVAHGVPESRVTTHGRGVSPGCPKDVAARDGSREQRLQCDRRVDINVIGK
jgi:OOP family OmpA-OmpF porin